MKELVQKIVEALVDHPEKVQINEIGSNSNTILELIVDKQDIGKVIGKKGRTADSIRTIIKSASAKLKRRVTLEIIG
jgi:predicted RNA-binding protein YlqC (UPF0109 family)